MHNRFISATILALTGLAMTAGLAMAGPTADQAAAEGLVNIPPPTLNAPGSNSTRGQTVLLPNGSEQNQSDSSNGLSQGRVNGGQLQQQQ